ncbi:P-loop containing nucleoside triphosphate hydrolase protein [Pisolithus croceorrhizus]|nr:P-loop containing nucleoside triphosphate hydrolase protein [Pisolithus croceorrhizus]
MSRQLSTVTPKLFRDYSPEVVFETSSDDSLDVGHLHSFLSTVMPEGAIGISASYRVNCQLSAIAFSSLSRALVVRLTSGRLPLASNEDKRKRITQARDLLQERILCSTDHQKYAFKMDRIAIALYLDVALRIVGAVDMLSVSLHNRRSLQAFMNAMGGEFTLHKSNVKALFFRDEPGPVSDSDLVEQAWAACQVSNLPHMASRFRTLRRIGTKAISDEHMAVFAKISRDGELLDSLKPLAVKNDVASGITETMDNLTLTCNRYPTRIRTSTEQFLQIETQKGVRVQGRTIHVQGRQAQIEVWGSLRGDKIRSVTTIGKADLTSAEAYRESVTIAILKGESGLLSNPFFKVIWLPDDPPKIPIYRGIVKVNASQERAIEKILSTSDKDRVALIQGPPGTGKAMVITAAVISIILCPDATSRTVWIAAQSNVAVKNIAGKFAKTKFYDFALLVSKDFHFEWHEDLYKGLESCLICSDMFSDDVDASRKLRGSRVILCTLGMLSNDHIAPFIHVNPVDILIFDEGSQIEVVHYLPVLHRFMHTLSKIVFIGDHKQLPPYGQEDISTLQSIFEVKHLHKEALFLDTQYRMPSAVGDFISWKVYGGELKTSHKNSVSLPCRFVDVRRGQEEQSGKSWVNDAKARVVVQIARAYQALKGGDFRIVTPYDAQRALIELKLKAANLDHDDKVFNVDSFQGLLPHFAKHIISVVRSDKLGFLANQRRTNAMLSRCKKNMVICTSQAFVQGPAASTLIGQLAAALGPEAWVYDVV